MPRATLKQMKRVFIAAAAAALAGCAGSGAPEADLPDSAALTVPGEPARATQGVPAESSVTGSPAGSQGSGSAPARQPAGQSEPVLKQPPPPRDTRPSIPWPPDTITLRRDTN